MSKVQVGHLQCLIKGLFTKLYMGWKVVLRYLTEVELVTAVVRFFFLSEAQIGKGEKNVPGSRDKEAKGKDHLTEAGTLLCHLLKQVKPTSQGGSKGNKWSGFSQLLPSTCLLVHPLSDSSQKQEAYWHIRTYQPLRAQIWVDKDMGFEGPCECYSIPT